MSVQNQSPNILWICTDQQRWDTLSCLGHPGAKTPNIDTIAESGVAFTRAYCQSPICTPSRASFLTGLYPISHQVHRNGNVGFPSHLPLLPKMAKDAGYRTGLIGKLHLSRAQGIVEKRPDDGYDEFYWSQHPDPDWDKGHDYQDWLVEKGVDPKALYADQKGAIRTGVPSQYHQTTWAGERAQDFVTRNKGQRWLLSINLYDPHPPFDPPKEYRDQFDPKDMPKPVFEARDVDHHEKLIGRVDLQAQKAVNPNHADDDSDYLEPTDEGAHDRPPESFDGAKLRAAYHAMIAQIDDMIGCLVETLGETGQLDNTLFIFMSDHGEMLGDHGLLYKGCRFYEGLVHVPLVVSYPNRIKQPLVSDALVELVDLPQTILEFAGIDASNFMQGQSLVPLLTGVVDQNRHKDFVLSEYFDAINYEGSIGSRGSMYFDGRYKLCVYHDAGTGELFDHHDDPDEHNDLWDLPGFQCLKKDLLQKHFNAMMQKSGKGPDRTADF
ncbi:MAG: sulfatase-like hydrolase/transferase [Rhizobiaceae bacterium]|nr:sulfatase-like hydrolase/transferase [Rhizobiaceae bacterium]